jgi:hypothetical protein
MSLVRMRRSSIPNRFLVLNGKTGRASALSLCGAQLFSLGRCTAHSKCMPLKAGGETIAVVAFAFRKKRGKTMETRMD